MAKSEKQKLKLIYILKLLMEYTDDEHFITTNEIIEKLSGFGISAERKSIYTDIAALEEYGLDIEKVRGVGYHLITRPFELAELKLLVDSVQASKFISEKKSNELIKKLETFSSHYEAGLLQRQVYVNGRVKSENEASYYSVDCIHEAINKNKKISFLYYEWTIKRELEPRKNGKTYVISPWALTWYDDNYYMIGYDSEASKIKHYRVDKMKKTEVTEELREGKECFSGFDITAYSKQTFGMFGGEITYVKLECEKSIIGVILDRFGKETMVVNTDENHFSVTVTVALSRQFLGWLFSLGSQVKVLEPGEAVTRMKELAAEVMGLYDEVE